MAEHDATRRTLELDLDDAVKRDERWLAFQPLWRLGSDDVIGAEALVRWGALLRGGQELTRQQQAARRVVGCASRAPRMPLWRSRTWRTRGRRTSGYPMGVNRR